MERLSLPPLHPRHEVDSIFVVASDLSTSGKKAPGFACALQAAEPDIKVFPIMTSGTDQKANREKLWTRLDEGHDEGYRKPLVIAAGGDGTAHYVGKDMLHPDAPKYINEAFLTSWGLGKENDLFARLHGPKMKGSPHILSHQDGHEVISHPLEIRAVVEDGLVEDIALAYATLGPSADAAVLLASKEHRQYRQRFPRWMHTLVDMHQSIPTVLGRPDPAHTVPELDHPSRPIVEAEFNNAGRMAGKANFSRSTGLSDHAMHYVEQRDNHPLKMLWFAARLAMGVPPGERTTGPVFLRFKDGGLHGQIEGEPIRNKAGKIAVIAAIIVKPGDKPLHYYATKKERHPYGGTISYR